MSIDPEMQEILNVFFQESEEGLAAMESGLLTLGAANCSSVDVINTIFRAAHSIKGGAGTFGFMEISQFTHSVETLLDEMRNGRRAVSPEALQLLLQSVDVTRDLLRCAQAGQPLVMTAAEALSGDLAQLLAHKAAAAGMPAAAPVSVAAAVPTSGSWRIAFAPDPSVFKTCNDPARLFVELATLGTLEVLPHVDSVPPLGKIDPTACYLHWSLRLHADVTQSAIAEIFDWVDANSTIAYEWVPAVTPLVPSAPLPTPVPAHKPAAAPVAKAAGDSGSIRVATEKVDALINLVGELVITQSMLGRFADTCDPADLDVLRRGLTQLSRNTRELQESVMAIRMLPIGFCFNRFPRLVHDLSRKLGKKVELKLNGENTELDKIVLEKIGDPLVHLVRNSLDHGLETPDVRVAAGKPETGLLELNAYHEGGSIIIEVKDDGAGLNHQRILAKARERGLVKPDEVLGDEQVHNLIFEAGFSTAESLSDVSGRGVGMDVVRRNIADLGGHVQIASVQGAGSTIRIRLPLTLAILDGQMLRIGSEIYVASLVSIIETVQPLREHLSSVIGQTELFKHRDAYIPILRLHELFDIEPDHRDIARGLLVVVEADGRRAAILVDELLAQQQVVIKSLETNFRQVPGLAGATIHGDGTVALILDVPGLITHFLQAPSRRVGRAA